MKYFRKTQREFGSYIDAEGVRYTVEWCSRIVSPGNETPEDLGYEACETLETALEAWGLMPYVYPEEEILTEN